MIFCRLARVFTFVEIIIGFYKMVALEITYGDQTNIIIGAFTTQVAIAILVSLKRDSFFNDIINIILSPPDMFIGKGPFACDIEILDSNSMKIRTAKPPLIRNDGVLTASIKDLNNEDVIKIKVKNNDGDEWHSEHFSPTNIPANMESVS